MSAAGAFGRLRWLASFATSRISRSLWLASYELEERRAAHAAQGRYLRSAWCSVGLAVLVALRRG